jgi:hypothetical protein
MVQKMDRGKLPNVGRVLVKTVAGSHLFGTSTPSSDMDYKGVYLPSRDQILLGNYPDAISESTGDMHNKNSSEDIDVELYSLRKFLKMVENGDTAALELLFTPEDKIIEKDPLWDCILEKRYYLLSKKVNAMIGYARQQANKYGIKGSRMGELNNVIKALKEIEKGFDFANPKFKHNWEAVVEALKGFDHVHIITLQTSKNMECEETPALDILGKKFDWHCTFPHVLQILNKIYKNYGQRAREAKKNNGIDWKALSHAMRVMYQGQELMENGKITLPLKEDQRRIVMKIKKGEIDYKKVASMLEYNLEELEQLKDSSILPERVDKKLIEDIIKNLHLKVVMDV